MNRHLAWMTSPTRWPLWPFLPVIRTNGDTLDLGVLFDARHALGLIGLSATVFQTNLFLIPRQLETLLALPKETFDTAEEVLAAGWRVDGDAEEDR